MESNIQTISSAIAEIEIITHTKIKSVLVRGSERDGEPEIDEVTFYTNKGVFDEEEIVKLADREKHIVKENIDLLLTILPEIVKEKQLINIGDRYIHYEPY